MVHQLFNDFEDYFVHEVFEAEVSLVKWSSLIAQMINVS